MPFLHTAPSTNSMAIGDGRNILAATSTPFRMAAGMTQLLRQRYFEARI